MDIDGFYEQVSHAVGHDRRLRLAAVELGPDAVARMPATLAANGGADRVLLVGDTTPIVRAGEELKPWVRELLSGSGSTVDEVSLPSEHLQTTPENVRVVRDRIDDATTVVAVGSGTVADIVKHAVHEHELAAPNDRVQLVLLQTANSVCAYTSELTVLTKGGVKRTVPSRLPDRLVLDTTLLADAPLEYSLGGVGDAAVAASTIAEYRLADALGLGRWTPEPWLLLRGVRDVLLEGPPVMPLERDGADLLARALSVCGLAMTYAEESAPLSGLEHVTSHMLDMAAAHFGRPVGNHGSQCGLTTALVLIAFQRLLDTDISRGPLFNGDADQKQGRAEVERVFGEVDPTGAMAAHCWHDYSAKMTAWHARRHRIERAQREWDALSEELRGYLVEPRTFLAALARQGHPLRFEDVPPGIDEREASWAFLHARLMRKRVSIADVLHMAGLWSEDFVADVFDEFTRLRAEVEGA